jgi:hypothetical protein
MKVYDNNNDKMTRRYRKDKGGSEQKKGKAKKRT